MPSNNGMTTKLKQGSKRLAAATLALAMMLPTFGCNGQKTTAELIGILGSAVVSLETLEGNTALAAKVQTDYQAAETAVTNWKNGTPATDVIEALNLLETDLNLFPVSAKDQALIDLAIGTVDAILASLPTSSATPSPTAATGTQSPRRPVHLTNPPKNKGTFKTQWNALIAQQPTLSAAAIK